MFTVNSVNIALFNQTTLPLNLSNYYTQLVYQQDSNFNPIQWAFTHILTNMYFKHVKEGKAMTSVVFLPLFPCSLPLQYRCVAPGPAFTQLNPQETMMVLYNLTTFCTDMDPQVHTLPGLVPFTHAGIWVYFHSPLCRSQQLWRATSARTSMPMPLSLLATNAAVCLQGSSWTWSPRIWWKPSAHLDLWAPGIRVKLTPSSRCCCRQGWWR